MQNELDTGGEENTNTADNVDENTADTKSGDEVKDVADILYDAQDKEEGEAAEDSDSDSKTDGEEDSDEDDSKDKDEDSEDDDESDDDEEEDGAPEAYNDFSFPEGVEANETELGEFKELAKKTDLTQTQAQEFVDLATAQRVKAAEEFNQALEDGWQQRVDSWADEIQTDKELGGKDSDAKIGLAVKAIGKFGTPALKKAMNEMGFGNHPELVRAWYKVGKQISEGSFKSGGRPQAGKGKKDAASVLYPNQSTKEN